MSRKKVKLQYIINQSNRKASYNKRKTCLLKKVNEISTLCGIEACAIIYGENCAQPEVWPPAPGTRNVLRKFLGVTELERTKKAVDLEGFLRQSIEKSQEQLRKQILENQRKRFTNLIDHAIIHQQYDPNLVMLNEINDLSAFIDSNIKAVEQKLNSMNVNEHAGNGVEAMNGVEHQGNTGNAQGQGNGGNMQADVHGLDTNMGYGQEYLPWDFSMLP